MKHSNVTEERRQALTYHVSEWANENDGGWGVAAQWTPEGGGRAGGIVARTNTREEAERLCEVLKAEAARALVRARLCRRAADGPAGETDALRLGAIWRLLQRPSDRTKRRWRLCAFR